MAEMMHKGGGGGGRKGDGEEGGYIFPQVAKIFMQDFHKLSFSRESNGLLVFCNNLLIVESLIQKVEHAIP